MRPRSPMLLAIVAVLLAGAVATPARADEPVRVYTNADLEGLSPLPVQDAPATTFDRERWEFVMQFLELEYQRLDNHRDRALARAILRAETETAKEGPRYGLAWAPYPWLNGRPPHGTRPHRSPRDSYATPPGERITPLHARPSIAQQAFDKAAARAARH